MIIELNKWRKIGKSCKWSIDDRAENALKQCNTCKNNKLCEYKKYFLENGKRCSQICPNREKI